MLFRSARNELYPSGISGEKRSLPEHSPERDHHQKYELLKQRFADFGAEGVVFLDELVRTRRRGKDEAGRVLGLLATYHSEDLARALQRAVRYRAFSCPRWSGSWRRKHVPDPDGNHYRPRRRTNSTRSSGSLPYPLAPRLSIRRCWKKW